MSTGKIENPVGLAFQPGVKEGNAVDHNPQQVLTTIKGIIRNFDDFEEELALLHLVRNDCACNRLIRRMMIGDITVREYLIIPVTRADCQFVITFVHLRLSNSCFH